MINDNLIIIFTTHSEFISLKNMNSNLKLINLKVKIISKNFNVYTKIFQINCSINSTISTIFIINK